MREEACARNEYASFRASPSVPGLKRPVTGRSAIMVSAWAGQPTVDELEREAAAGLRPRKDYVEIARRLEADVIDGQYMADRARPFARRIASRIGMEQGQVLEVLSHARDYRHIVAWG